MDRRFAALTASLSALTFGGVWIATTPPGVSAAADLRETVMPDTTADASPVYYPGCNAVRAAGKAPLFRDQPGYRSEMDGDGDGIACEPHSAGGYGPSVGHVRSRRLSRR